MGHHPNRRALALALVAGTFVAASCGASGSTTGPVEAELTVDDGVVTVNDSPVSKGQTRQVKLDEQVVAGKDARGLLRFGALEFGLFKMTNMHLDSSEGEEVRSTLQSGHIHAALDATKQVRLRIETSTGNILTTLEPGTELTVCQTPPAPDAITCLHVEKGQVEWQSGGAAETYHAGQSAFGRTGEAPHAAQCVPEDAFDAWFRDARLNQTPKTLKELVGESPLCAEEVPSASTTVTTLTTSTISSTVPTTPTLAEPSTTKPRARPTTTATTQPATTQPATTQAPTTQPTTTQPTTTQPTTTQPTTTQPTTTQPTTTQPTTTQPTTTQPAATPTTTTQGTTSSVAVSSP